VVIVRSVGGTDNFKEIVNVVVGNDYIVSDKCAKFFLKILGSGV
jgi:hypothetical protein